MRVRTQSVRLICLSLPSISRTVPADQREALDSTEAGTQDDEEEEQTMEDPLFRLAQCSQGLWNTCCQE